jgi:hypothetical protein
MCVRERVLPCSCLGGARECLHVRVFACVCVLGRGCEYTSSLSLLNNYFYVKSLPTGTNHEAFLNKPHGSLDDSCCFSLLSTKYNPARALHLESASPGTSFVRIHVYVNTYIHPYRQHSPSPLALTHTHTELAEAYIFTMKQFLAEVGRTARSRTLKELMSGRSLVSVVNALDTSTPAIQRIMRVSKMQIYEYGRQGNAVDIRSVGTRACM